MHAAVHPSMGCRLASSCCALLSAACWHTTSLPDLAVTYLAPVVLGNVDWNMYRLTHWCAHSIIAYVFVAVPAGCSRVRPTFKSAAGSCSSRQMCLLA